MRSTTGTRTLTGQATTGTPRRRTATVDRSGNGGASSARATGGVSRPSLADVPGREKVKQAGPRNGVGTGGWAAYRQAKAERSERYQRFDVEKNHRHVIKFAEAEPFAFIYRHWVDRRPFTCIGEDCPLCDAGDRARPVVFYNIIDVEDATVKVWEMSADPTRRVQKHYDDLAEVEKTLDDDEFYFVVSKEQKDKSSWEYTVIKVRARDLQADYRTDPLDEAEIAEAMGKLYDESIIYVSSKDDLRQAVEKLED